MANSFVVGMAVWFIGVNALMLWMRQHMREKGRKDVGGIFPRGVYVADLFHPALFTERGNHIRRVALAWFLAGMVCLVVSFFLSPRA